MARSLKMVGEILNKLILGNRLILGLQTSSTVGLIPIDTNGLLSPSTLPTLSTLPTDVPASSSALSDVQRSESTIYV